MAYVHRYLQRCDLRSILRCDLRAELPTLLQHSSEPCLGSDPTLCQPNFNLLPDAVDDTLCRLLRRRGFPRASTQEHFGPRTSVRQE